MQDKFSLFLENYATTQIKKIVPRKHNVNYMLVVCQQIRAEYYSRLVSTVSVYALSSMFCQNRIYRFMTI